MKTLLAAACLAIAATAAAASDVALSGPTGLLTVPTATVQDDGTAALAFSNENPRPSDFPELENYLFTAGLLPGLEIGGRIAEGREGTGIRDLSFNAKWRFWRFENGPSFAIGGTDIGGEAQHFRSRYAVATLPWRTVSVTAGYGRGPDVLDGAFGGIEWRPWPVVALLAEHDAADVNYGVRLRSPEFWGGLRLSATAAHRGVNDEVEYGVGVSFPLGRRAERPTLRLKEAAGTDVGRQSIAAMPPVGADERRHGIADLRVDAGPVSSPAPLRAALEKLGFESVRTGTRGDNVLVVSLENRRYNHAAADGIGLALGTIAAHAEPRFERIELTLTSYWVPQVTVAVPAQLYRDFLRDRAGEAAVAQVLEVRYADAPVGVAWDNERAALAGAEVVVEPVLRTFAATEVGLLDYGLGARVRLTAPVATGLLFHAGLQAPLLLSDDLRDGGVLEGFAPEGGLDQLMFQYHHQLAPAWSWLWSAGRMKVFRSDLDALGLDQLWLSPEGRHQVHARMLYLRSSARTRQIALAGYTYFDPARRYSVSLTGGRFYSEDAGVRLELNRYFGDTVAGVFFKAASRDDQAVGFQVSLPLTPRRDAYPSALQLKGARRWGHSLSSTINDAEGRNPVRPLLLYEPRFDLDLRRDFYDSGRLGQAWLRSELPRMREAYWRWAGGQ